MYDPIEITRLLAFGTSNPSPDDYNAHIRPAGATPASITYNMLDYMTDGGGRFALPSLFGAVEKFFDSSIVIPDKDYTSTEITNLLGFTNDDLTTGISQYGTGITDADHVERSYIFGTTNFRLNISNAIFKVRNGVKTIENMEVRAFDDNFDFDGGNPLANLVNGLFLEPTFDPYGLGRGAVEINFTGLGKQYAVYEQADFYLDDFNERIISDTSKPVDRAAKDAIGIAALSVSGGIPYFLNIGNDPFLSFKRNDFKVIYGTPGDDALNPLDAELSFDIYFEYLMVGGDGDDAIEGGDFADEILGGTGVDILLGAGANDILNGGADNDYLDGEKGEDVAIFSDNFENYDYAISKDKKTITIDHIYGTQKDGTDTLKNIEWAEFGRKQVDTGTLVASSSLGGIPIATEPRLIPLPLADGVETTEYIEVESTVANPNPNDPPTPPQISLTAPVSMLDGDIDYTLHISPYQPDTQYNVVYVIDTSVSIDSAELQTMKNAYTDLTNFFVNQGIAENINFGVVSFDVLPNAFDRDNYGFYPNSNGSLNLTADEAVEAIDSLVTTNRAGTRYFDGLDRADQFLLNSSKNPFETTGIGYFFTDGQNSGDRFDMLLKARDIRELANFQAIGYYTDLNSLTSNSLQIRDINWIDSNQGVFIDDISDLSTELLKSDLADDIELVNILLDGEVVDTIAPDVFTDNPLGLTYEGSVDGLDVSIDAENIITAEVVFTPESNFATTAIDYTVTAGESQAVDGEGNDIPQSNDGNEDPFERMVDGGDSDDEITLGYVDRGANGGAGNDEIIGNRRDNILDGGAGNDTISAYEGDDVITTGAGRDKVNGGEGIDTAVYNDVAYQDNSITLRKVGNSVSYNNTDTLTDVEFIQLSDVRISTDTLEITPVVEVAELSITEGDSELTTAQLDFNLSTPAPIDISFDYSSEDLENGATAGVDYTATSGTVIIPAGETSASINLEIIGDKQEEEDEQFGLNFSNLLGATFSNNLTNDAVGITISDDDITLPDNAIAEYGTISNLSHTKQTIDLINTYTNPVVFVQPPSYNEEDPAIVRLDNITADSFEAMIQEPEHNDGIHSSETASYFVFEAGSWQLPDGTLLEVGTNSSSGLIKQGFDEIEFEQDFETSPVILSTVQTNNGTQFVRTRQNNITKDGFSVGMEEEEANQLSGHATEELGWLAIEPGSSTSNDTTILAGQTGNSVTHEWSNVNFNNLFDDAPQLIAGISSYDGSDPSKIRYRNLSSDAVEIKVEEDQSSDSETDHTTEVVDFLAVEGSGILSAVPTPQETIIGEVGTITNLNHLNQTITLNNTYTNPVVFALPLSYNDEDPAIARIHDIESDSFSVYLKEPEYLDDQHADETVTYLVIEAGSWQLEDGTMLEVGSLDTNQMTTQSWEGINLKSDFSETPAVLSSVQTNNGTQFVRTRQKGKSVDGFELSLEEEDALKESGHATETVGWLAMETGGGSWSGFDYTVGSTAEAIDDSWDTINFGQTFDTTPNLLASLSSYVGADPAGLRYRSLGASQVQMKVEEDTSLDSEIGHIDESVDFLAIAGTGNLSAVSANSFI